MKPSSNPSSMEEKRRRRRATQLGAENDETDDDDKDEDDDDGVDSKVNEDVYGDDVAPMKPSIKVSFDRIIPSKAKSFTFMSVMTPTRLSLI